MDDLAAEVARLDKLKVDCTTGYVIWSIWPMRDDIWGQPNGRKMTNERRSEMYKSFVGSGIQNVKNDTVIVVPAKKSWIKNALNVPSIDGLTTSDIPTLEWTDAGKEAFD
jgi:hypothetical protein